MLFLSLFFLDMGLLNIDIIANGDIIGQVNIENIGVLCHSRPIQGWDSHFLQKHGSKESFIKYCLITIVFSFSMIWKSPLFIDDRPKSLNSNYFLFKSYSCESDVRLLNSLTCHFVAAWKIATSDQIVYQLAYHI